MAICAPTVTTATAALPAPRTQGGRRGGSLWFNFTCEFNAKTQRRQDAKRHQSKSRGDESPVSNQQSTNPSFASLRLCVFALTPVRVALGCVACFAVPPAPAAELPALKPDAFAHHIEHFNAMEDENVTNFVANAASWDWLAKNIPLFECPDREVEELYYFRWWSFRKHLVNTPKGFVITEFLTPVKHADIYNTISCGTGFHLAEGRWLRDPRYLDDYTRFWLRGENGGPPQKAHNFSSWLAAAAYDRYLVNHDRKYLVGLLTDLVADYRRWEAERRLPNGLFWQYDVRDGMEESLSGSRTAQNLRPTINSYMFANARALAAIARLAKKPKLAAEFDAKADELKRLTQENLWDGKGQFFKVLVPSVPSGSYQFSDAREELGFVPWMFNLPAADKGYEAAWVQFADPQGFRAPYGLTTAERRHPRFRSHGVGTCEWDGAVWPFATSQTLYALGNLLRGPADISLITPHASRITYYDAFLTYVHSQHANGKPFIGEYLDEVTGDWINKNDRSRYYNHSTFADLLITGVIGLRPRADDVVEINPLLPTDTWDWFCLDGVKYHGRMLTVIWDQDGSRYGRGAGLRVLANGKEMARSATLERLTGKLP